MKTLNCLIIIIISLSLNCNTKETYNYFFNFDNEEFVLPDKIKAYKKQHKIKYYLYRGFRGSTQNYTTILQLENNPIWFGTKNVLESFYEEKSIAGITFSTSENVLDSLRYNFEKENNKKFSLSKDLYIMEITDKITLVLRDYDSKIYISYYYLLNKRELEKYVKNVF